MTKHWEVPDLCRSECIRLRILDLNPAVAVLEMVTPEIRESILVTVAMSFLNVPLAHPQERHYRLLDLCFWTFGNLEWFGYEYHRYC